MQTQTREILKLQQRINELEAEIEFLSVTPSYRVLTRGAIERRWLSLEKRKKAIILFDIDHLHNLNQQFGYEEMNRKIRLGLDSVRSSELLGLVFSGDEFITVVNKSETRLMTRRLRETFGQYGITLTIVVSNIISNDFPENYQRLVSFISKLKAENKRNSINYFTIN